jgi:dethiobiotin synthetase
MAIDTMKTLLVTGTDTGVGKTWVTSLLIRQFRQRGFSTGAYKPACSGAETNAAGESFWSDVEALRAACGNHPDEDLVCPQRFQAAVAPNVAAGLENRSVDDQLLVSGADRWKSYVDWLLIEGAGGVFCPLSDHMTVMDLATTLRTPVIVVAANRLGVINHTRLTVDALISRGLNVRAIVLNEIAPEAGDMADASIPSNADQLQHWLPNLPMFHCAWRADKLSGVTTSVDIVDFLTDS